MTRTAAIALLLVPVLAVAGLTAGAVVNGEASGARAAAAKQYEAAFAAAQDAHDAALDARDAVAESLERAEAAIEAAEALRAVPAGTVEADDLTYLEALIAAAEAAKIAPEPVPELPALPGEHSVDGYLAGVEQLALWRERVDAWAELADPSELDRAASALRAGTYSTAGTAGKWARGVLDGNAGASAETREALTAAIAELAAVIDDHGDAAPAVSAIASAGQAVKDSQAAADAAAAAAASANAAQYVPVHPPALYCHLGIPSLVYDQALGEYVFVFGPDICEMIAPLG